MTIRSRVGNPAPRASSASRSASHTVGTPAENVTASPSINSMMPAGSSRDAGMTSDAPTSGQTYGKPHAVT